MDRPNIEKMFEGQTVKKTFVEQFGFQYDRFEADGFSVRAAVGRHLMQPMGIVHGGVYASIAESLTSMATHLGVVDEGMTAVGMSNNTSFMRPLSEGTIHAEGKVVHRGRTTWIWTVEMRNDEGKLCAMTLMTLAVRPAL